GLSKPVTAQTLPQTARQDVSNTNVLRPGMYRIDNSTTQTRALQSPQTIRNTNPRVSTSTGVNHKTNVSRPQHRSNQLKDKVVPNNSKTLNVIAVCATCEKRLVDSDHFACVTKMLNDVNARTKKPNVVPISTRKPKGHANKSVTTPHKKKVASKSTNQKPKSYYKMLYEIIVQLILFIVDFGCTKHMTGNLKLLCNFVEKFLVLRYDGDECDKGIMPTKIELTLEQSQQGISNDVLGRMPTKIEQQSQQGISNDVLVSIEGVKELKRNVWIKGLKKEAFPTLKADAGSIHMLLVFTKVNYGIEDKTSWTQ
nr:hypothetical protein [Tanacetum cinerariifolium]